jgi:hypothetical protein
VNDIEKQGYGIQLTNQYLKSAMDHAVHVAIQHSLNVMKFGSEYDRKHHVVRTPNPEWADKMIAQAEFLKRWYTLNQEGLDNGWLSDDPYEGLTVTEIPEFNYETVYDETEEECEARRATLPDTVTFKIHTDPVIPDFGAGS